ncbi:MAG TPA: AraC family transcriptional regulator [Mobilitalea sp.]|nr:AraC family transcriptional regulator [Mobilitalea sp.]
MNSTKEVIENVLDFIEVNLKTKIILEDISDHCHISKYHLHRMFKSLTGESLMDYVLCRKLSSSVEYLLNTNLRIIDISNEFGFDYEQNYIRAFKKVFHQTPFQIRNSISSIHVTEKITIDEILSIGNVVTYKPQFILKPTFQITGIRHKVWFSEGLHRANDLAKEFVYSERDKIDHILKQDIYIGYTDWKDTPSQFNYYIPAAITDKKQVAPPGMVNLVIPTNKYVVFKFIGFFSPDEITGEHIGSVLQHLYVKWIFESGYEFADLYRFEYIDTSISRDGYCEMDIYQPIRSRNESIEFQP